MPIEGKCAKCGGVTSDYGCLNCTMNENEELRDNLGKSKEEIEDLRDLCRSAFSVIRDGVTDDRVGKIEVCILQGNLWRAANAIPLTFARCGCYLKTTTSSVSDTCGLRAGHEGKCEKV
jgi:hypothetical protein